MSAGSIARAPWSRRAPVVTALAVAAIVAIAASVGRAQQEPAAAPATELQAAVERYFTVTEEAKAETLAAELVAKYGADPAALLRAVMTPPPPHPGGERFELRVPFEDKSFPLEVAPPPKAAAGAPPVVLDLWGNTVSTYFPFTAPALCWVANYTPDEFSDSGRDSFRKFLNTASFAVGGDPDRFWLVGYSWSGHAAFDVPEHRPGLVRGVVALGGGPRRTHWRLLPNLAGTRVLSCCGGKDDAELVWNLQELARTAPSLHLDVKVTIDPEKGHPLPLKGMDDVAPVVDTLPAVAPTLAKSGALLADAPRVALPWLEVVAVDPAAVAIPDRVPVDSAMSRDEQRRATIRGLGNVARLNWKCTPTKSGIAVDLTSKGVTEAALFVKAPWFDPAKELVVTVRGKKVFDGKIAVDPATLLAEARRTGDRQRPTLAKVVVKF